MGVMAVRVVTSAVFLATLVFCYRERRRLGPWLRDYFLRPTSPLTLGLLRIILFALLWNAARMADPEWHAALPEELRVPPFGWGFLGTLPFHAGAAAGARDALVVTSSAAALGLFTRITVPVSALLAVYVFGLPQCFGKVNHGGHARMLCVLALSLSPCGDALSLDAVIRRLRGQSAPKPQAAYTLPVRAVWLLVGTTYLFPGLWKLVESGDLWLSGDQLRVELYKKWGSTPEFHPLVRVDRYPWVLRLLGIGTIAFEVGFFFAMFQRRTRILAALAAVGFHLGVAAVMGIRFPFYVPLIVLVEVPERPVAALRRLLEPLLARARARLTSLQPLARLWVPTRSFPARRLIPSAVLLSTLFAAQVAAGVTRTSSWPISVYPTFSARKVAPSDYGLGRRVVLETKSGEVHELGPVLKKARVASVTRMVERLAERATNKKRTSQGREIVELFRYLGVPVEPGDHIVLSEATWDLFPLGKRAGYREEPMRRFLVRDDLSLSGLRTSRRPGRLFTPEGDGRTPGDRDGTPLQ
jgi:hypothetical protein